MSATEITRHATELFDLSAQSTNLAINLLFAVVDTRVYPLTAQQNENKTSHFCDLRAHI